MSGRGFRAPFIPKQEIQDRADEFRARHWPSGQPPVDIEQIIECDLDMRIIPVSGLRESSDTDALLLGDLRSIAVDMRMYMDERMEKRMRYSFAHEIGHLILHGHLLRDLGDWSVATWLKFQRSIPDDQNYWIEQHAYEFAGRLLVPLDVLKDELEKQIARARRAKVEGWDASGQAAIDFLAHAIATRGPFGVSEQVIARRLRIEGLVKA